MKCSLLRLCEQLTINSLIASSYNLRLESTGTGGQLRSLCVVGCAAYESDEIQNKAMLSPLSLQLELQLGLA